MLRFLMCLFGLHGSREIDYINDDESEVFYKTFCRDCGKKID